MSSRETSRASPPRRLREDGLASLQTLQEPILPAALGLLSSGLSKPLARELGRPLCNPAGFRSPVDTSGASSCGHCRLARRRVAGVSLSMARAAERLTLPVPNHLRAGRAALYGYSAAHRPGPLSRARAVLIGFASHRSCGVHRG